MKDELEQRTSSTIEEPMTREKEPRAGLTEGRSPLRQKSSPERPPRVMIDIRVQPEPFDIAAEQEGLWRGRPQLGALVSFIGLMRDMNEGERVNRMTLEHYPGMTERALTAIAEEAAGRWEVRGIRILHRVGELAPQDPIVLVAVTAAHRGEAFRACEFLIDYLKTRAPFWKKEITDDGERWVDARATDDRAANRWER
jgi:molybdopterin synthase catalytic subunit